MEQQELIPHLFKTEYGKITSVLCNHFGIDFIEIAEDLTSETFLAALESWTYKGIPKKPTAWLYTVAKNKAKNYLLRDQIFLEKIAGEIKGSSSNSAEVEIDLSDQNISDSQLRMLFTICQPSIPAEAQIGLALRILCGFGIDEIATAFLTNKETINKRLFRAKEKLRLEKVSLGYPAEEEIPKKLDTVLATLYLLFNEGYYSESQDSVLRENLCVEAMRLTHLLMADETTNLPRVKALLSLMCFHSSRFRSRKNESGEMVLYHDQDETLWNYELITKGAWYLKEASQGNNLSNYHLEAGIAYWHTNKADTREKWKSILKLYNLLLQKDYSPVAALNRTFAFSKVYGQEKAIEEAEKLHFTSNHYYFTLLGELYTGIDQQKAGENYQKALSLARTQVDKLTITKKLNALA